MEPGKLLVASHRSHPCSPSLTAQTQHTLASSGALWEPAGTGSVGHGAAPGIFSQKSPPQSPCYQPLATQSQCSPGAAGGGGSSAPLRSTWGVLQGQLGWATGRCLCGVGGIQGRRRGGMGRASGNAGPGLCPSQPRQCRGRGPEAPSLCSVWALLGPPGPRNRRDPKRERRGPVAGAGDIHRALVTSTPGYAQPRPTDTRTAHPGHVHPWTRTSRTRTSPQPWDEHTRPWTHTTVGHTHLVATNTPTHW